MNIKKLFGFEKPAVRKSEVPVFVAPQPSPEMIEWEQFKERHPVGTTITYLGIPMCVTFAASMYRASSLIWQEGWLICEYADKNGVVREWRIGMNVALKAVVRQDQAK